MITVIEDVVLYPPEDGEKRFPAAICVICIVTRATEIIAKLGLIWIAHYEGSSEDKEELDSAKRFEEMLASSMACTGILLRLGIIGRCHSRDISNSLLQICFFTG